MSFAPYIIRKRLAVMSFADLDAMHKLLVAAGREERAKWVADAMTAKMFNTFNTTTNDDEVIVSK